MATKFDQTDPMYEKIMAAHDAAVAAGLTEYKDPKSGFSVMTEPFLKSKGFSIKVQNLNKTKEHKHLLSPELRKGLIQA